MEALEAQARTSAFANQPGARPAGAYSEVRWRTAMASSAGLQALKPAALSTPRRRPARQYILSSSRGRLPPRRARGRPAPAGDGRGSGLAAAYATTQSSGRTRTHDGLTSNDVGNVVHSRSSEGLRTAHGLVAFLKIANAHEVTQAGTLHWVCRQHRRRQGAHTADDVQSKNSTAPGSGRLQAG